MSMIMKYSLIVPYTTEKTTIDTIASGHQLSQCIDLSMYRYTPNIQKQLPVQRRNQKGAMTLELDKLETPDYKSTPLGLCTKHIIYDLQNYWYR